VTRELAERLARLGSLFEDANHDQRGQPRLFFVVNGIVFSTVAAGSRKSSWQV
jgi:hypothetical protein